MYWNSMGITEIDMERPVRLVRDNPKRAGTLSAMRYEAYKHASTLRGVLELGGSRADILHDLGKGFITFTDQRETPQPRTNSGSGKKRVAAQEVTVGEERSRNGSSKRPRKSKTSKGEEATAGDAEVPRKKKAKDGGADRWKSASPYLNGAITI